MTGWVLVTGAAKRIGREIALDLATHGWDIVIHYHRSGDEARQLAEEIHAMGVNACLAEFDLENTKLLENLIPSLAEEIGMIDALVNNASIFEPDDQDPNGTRHMALNAEAPKNLSKSFRDHLPPREKGVIVNLLDASPAPPHFSHYRRSKDFLNEMTLNMAKSFAPQVRVNGVAPTYVLKTPRQTEESFQQMSGGKIIPPQQVALAVRQLIETPSVTGKIAILEQK